MDINNLLAGVDCPCGKRHACAIEAVYIESGAIERFSELCRSYTRILIVADENTFRAAGEPVLAALSGKSVETVMFSGTELLVPNEAAVDTVTAQLGSTELIIGIGSGVIQDLCKYVSHFHHIPYMVCATAPSMDGYASNGAAMILAGMKETVSAGLPLAIVGDTRILTQAPMDMIKAGYGDIIGKFSALNDWKLSRLINDEYFCSAIYDITCDQIRQTLSLADGILTRQEESIRVLMEALVVIGIMMSFAGSSRPASGSEHHLSHFFEITGILNHTEYFPHGIDVAYSTVVTAELREKILACRPFPAKRYRLTDAQYRQTMEAIYSTSAAGCIALQEKVGNYSCDRSSLYTEREEQIRQILLECPSSQEIKRMLSLVQLDMDAFYQLYSNEKIEQAILYAKDLKDRYTVLWLYYDMFGGEHDV